MKALRFAYVSFRLVADVNPQCSCEDSGLFLVCPSVRESLFQCIWTLSDMHSLRCFADIVYPFVARHGKSQDLLLESWHLVSCGLVVRQLSAAFVPICYFYHLYDIWISGQRETRNKTSVQFRFDSWKIGWPRCPGQRESKFFSLPIIWGKSADPFGRGAISSQARQIVCHQDIWSHWATAENEMETWMWRKSPWLGLDAQDAGEWPT